MSEDAAAEAEAGTTVDKDDAIRTVLGRLARSHPSGGVVIERAAILAEGADCTAVVAWITAHDGQPEAAKTSSKSGGLHGARLSDPVAAGNRPPARYVLPAGALA
jgi:hypothetical protein